MREVFSRIEERNLPLPGRQFVMLSLESPAPGGPGEFVVRESRSRWDAQKNQVAWEDVQTLCFLDIQDARLKYADARLQLIIRGFQNISSTLATQRSTMGDDTAETAMSRQRRSPKGKSTDGSI